MQGHTRQPRKTTKSIEMHAVWVWTRKAQGTITVLDGANNYCRGVRFSDSATTASTSVSLTIIIGPTS